MKIFNKAAMTAAPSAILIDLDDTLYDYASSHEAALQQVGELVNHKLGIDEDRFREIYAAARKSVKTVLKEAPAARSRLLYFQAMFEAAGFGSSIIDALNCEQTYWSRLLQAAEPFDGVRDFLDEARLKSIPLVLVTNLTAQIQFQKLAYFGMADAFEYVVTSEQIGVEKPHKRIFRAAATRLADAAQNIWMIGDDLDCDIAGARQALDCVTVAKRNGRSEKQIRASGCDAMFEDYDKLTALLSKLTETGNA